MSVSSDYTHVPSMIGDDRVAFTLPAGIRVREYRWGNSLAIATVDGGRIVDRISGQTFDNLNQALENKGIDIAKAYDPSATVVRVGFAGGEFHNLPIFITAQIEQVVADRKAALSGKFSQSAKQQLETANINPALAIACATAGAELASSKGMTARQLTKNQLSRVQDPVAAATMMTVQNAAGDIVWVGFNVSKIPVLGAKKLLGILAR